MNKDNVDGAEALLLKTKNRVRYMTYQQIVDSGGILEIMYHEYMRMVDEWTNQTVEQAKSVSNESVFDIMDDIKRRADEINKAYNSLKI